MNDPSHGKLSKYSSWNAIHYLLFVVVAVWYQLDSVHGFGTDLVNTIHYRNHPTRFISRTTFHSTIPPTTTSTTLFQSKNNNKNKNAKSTDTAWSLITVDPQRSILFSMCMIVCGALLGPFLDSYHSAFGVLQYKEPIQWVLWGTSAYPALTTAWWVPELFGLAGFLIGWLYICLDSIFLTKDTTSTTTTTSSTTITTPIPSPPKILIGIALFTLQYWLSGELVQAGVDRTTILNGLSVVAASGFWILDGTTAGLLTSLATAIGGPLIEVGLLWCTRHGILQGGYQYTDLGETGFFPLWIVPVYFLGGPANGNLARGFWSWLLSTQSTLDEQEKPTCVVCNDTRCVPCPNCDGIGTYTAMGGRTVTCTSCKGRGFVICRACFDQYKEDPYDIDTIRDKMARMPD